MAIFPSLPDSPPRAPPHLSHMTPIADFDPGIVEARYNREPFLFRHHLCDHPLLQPDALIALTRRLPPESIELNAADVDVSELDPVRPPHRLSPEETIRQIEHCNTWVGLKHLATLPDYRALLDRCLDELAPSVERVDPGIFARQGFLFLSSPRAVVPCHFDPEHNFLYQLRGRKIFTILDKTDRRILSEMDIERHYATGYRKLIFANEHARSARVFELRPGDVLHVPISAPHHVRNLDEVNLSLSVTFRTPGADRRENLYVVNHALRRLGLEPSPVGSHPGRDAVKHGVYRALRTLRHLGG